MGVLWDGGLWREHSTSMAELHMSKKKRTKKRGKKKVPRKKMVGKFLYDSNSMFLESFFYRIIPPCFFLFLGQINFPR